MEQLVFAPRVLMASLYVFALAAFLGYQIISRVPPLLHTPLMSATNALSAISVVGALRFQVEFMSGREFGLRTRGEGLVLLHRARELLQALEACTMVPG